MNQDMNKDKTEVKFLKKCPKKHKMKSIHNKITITITITNRKFLVPTLVSIQLYPP